MPNLSHNSTPTLAPQEYQEYKNHSKSETNSKFTEQDYPKQASSNTSDWFYGTEELLDALPKLWTRSVVYVLVGFSVITLPWAMFSTIDETGSARGRIEPKEATHKLDAQAGGNVIAVRVKAGDSVKAGQVLVELESEVLQTNLKQMEAKLDGLINQQAQLNMLHNQVQLAVNIQEQQNKSQELEKIAEIKQAQQNLDAKQSNYNLQKLEKKALVHQAKQNIDSSQTTQKLAKSRWSRDISEVERFQELSHLGAIPRIKVVELEKEAEESQLFHEKSQSDIKQAKWRVQEEQSRYQAVMNQAQTDIQQARLRLQEEQSSYQSVVSAGKLAVLRNQQQLKNLQAQISGLQSQIAQTRSQVTSLKIQLQQKIVRSPIDGIIFDLPVSKAGSMVQMGQRVAQIAPDKSALILKAEIPSKDSGFLKTGNPVKIKFDAYPFQDYGVVPGQVTWIAPDSKVKQTPQGNTEIYELEVTLNQAYIQSGNKHIPLTPGQTANAEVIIRQRRIIDFILDPFKRLQKDGLEI